MDNFVLSDRLIPEILELDMVSFITISNPKLDVWFKKMNFNIYYSNPKIWIFDIPRWIT